ncbi:Arrestin (or S-antigen), C-terminal domain [Popillia japonica]|uniref:peptidylprolyl isomerase n=1 Tax=Popillia japonica TaxID=7064 RepID=A0AAW1IYX7_POPJA
MNTFKNLLLIYRNKKAAEELFGQIQKRGTTSENKDSKRLQIGIKKRPKNCSDKSKKGDLLHVHYKGLFENGTEFDTSYTRQIPFTFTVILGRKMEVAAVLKKTFSINFTNCNILEVDYKLKVTACISGLHHDLDVEIPITLGSIRIRDDNEVQQPVSIFAGLGTPYTHDGRGDTAGTSAKLIDTSAGWRIPQEKNGSGSST